jgi:WD40 repeat protein
MCIRDSSRTSRLERDLRQRLGLLRQRLPFPVVRCWLPAYVSDWYSGAVPLARATDRWNAPRLRLNQDEVWIDSAHGRRLRLSLKTGLHQLQDPSSRSGDGTVMVVDVDQRVRLTQSADGTMTLQQLNSTKPPLVLEKPKSVPSIPCRIWLCCEDQRLVVQFGDPVSPEKSFKSRNLIWDLTNGRLLDVMTRGPELTVSNDKRVAFVSTYQHEVIDLMSGKAIRQIPRPPRWQHIQVFHSADGQTTAIANSNPIGVVIQGGSTGSDVVWHEPVNNGNSVTELQFSSDDSELWAGTSQGTIHCRSLHDPNQSISSINAGKGAITSISPDPSGRWVACGNALGEVRVLERTGHCSTVLPHNDSVQSIDWSSDGDLIGVLTRQGLLTVWDLKSRDDGAVTVCDSTEKLSSVAFHPSGDQLLTGSADGRIELRDSSTGRLRHEVASGEPVYRVAWNPSGSHFAAVTRAANSQVPLATKVVKTWVTAKPESPLATGTPLAADSNAMAMPLFHPLDNRVFVHSFFTAFLLSCENSKFTCDTPLLKVDSTGWVRCAAISSDGRYVAIVGFCLHGSVHQIYVYSTNTKQNPRLLQLPMFDDCWQLAFAPDGRTLIAVGDFGTRAWNVETGQEIHQGTVGWQIAAKGVYFSSSGRKMIITDFHNSTRLFSADESGGLDVIRQISNEPLRLPTTGQPTAAAFVSDESIVMIATAAGLHLFSTEKGDALMPMLRHEGGATDVAFDAKGGRVAIGGQSSSLRIWKPESPAVEPLQELLRLSRRYALSTVDTSRGTLVPLSTNGLKTMNDDLTCIVTEAKPLDARERRVWHANQAAECRLMNLPMAEQFHRDRAASERPDGLVE